MSLQTRGVSLGVFQYLSFKFQFTIAVFLGPLLPIEAAGTLPLILVLGRGRGHPVNPVHFPGLDTAILVLVVRETILLC